MIPKKILVSSLYAWRTGKLEAGEEVKAVGNNLNGEFRQQDLEKGMNL